MRSNDNLESAQLEVERPLTPEQQAVVTIIAGILGFSIGGMLSSLLVQIEPAAVPFAGIVMGLVGGAALGLAKRSLHATILFALVSAAGQFLGLLAGRMSGLGPWVAFALAGWLTGAALTALNTRKLLATLWGAVVGAVGFAFGASLYYGYLNPGTLVLWMLFGLVGAIGGLFVGAVIGTEANPKI